MITKQEPWKPWLEKTCTVCEKPFITEQEWDNRHDDEDGGDCHERCCPICEGWIDDDYIVKTEDIECPKCTAVCKATVTHSPGQPFSNYVHECEHCGYVITESEWQSVR